MLRQHENSEAFKAGALSVAVHALLLGALLISFNWKTTHPVSIAEVELWDSLPVEKTQKSSSVKPPEPVVIPEPVKESSKPEPAPTPLPKVQVDIVIKKKPPEKLKPPPKKPDALAALQKDLMQDAVQAPRKQVVDDALKKLQQEALTDEKAEEGAKNNAVKLAVSNGVVNEFKARIQAKIRANVNKSLCGDGNPELKFEIGLMPTGELSGNPRLTKSSGNVACDDAVDRAIRASVPLPLPEDKSLFTQFRNLKLTFYPNSD
ncbi:MAG: cell envelope biogenesis protein TolA [Betaproteobacteria bacterium HGW-Betaproteobacteria-22]|nr:MAG: cell envelope biogenesis protein TolA [Betaproteobacteria bacterium HGW-Betaproteobacteria-22]